MYTRALAVIAGVLIYVQLAVHAAPTSSEQRKDAKDRDLALEKNLLSQLVKQPKSTTNQDASNSVEGLRTLLERERVLEDLLNETKDDIDNIILDTNLDVTGETTPPPDLEDMDTRYFDTAPSRPWQYMRFRKNRKQGKRVLDDDGLENAIEDLESRSSQLDSEDLNSPEEELSEILKSLDAKFSRAQQLDESPSSDDSRRSIDLTKEMSYLETLLNPSETQSEHPCDPKQQNCHTGLPTNKRGRYRMRDSRFTSGPRTKIYEQDQFPGLFALGRGTQYSLRDLPMKFTDELLDSLSERLSERRPKYVYTADLYRQLKKAKQHLSAAENELRSAERK